ncbi:methylated-DNA--[protein]-cysteine S-methyltransferase [Arthrobacter sp. MYb224]|uniref:methylated-DNA--[protein]-cysteine S-methyltransferase n=1 Tax=Micrococcaceae TaxID=1268 RepID=UPI000BB90331|nr:MULTISPECIES: methylated-DNA--[protein]-cysteine S-methyltransferase [Micrococcaceae]PCC28916.1 cysteine methyltransferase [Glutamicibacter sp. BW80]PQZ98805.1 methylated-DNA--[protein]-cysteine S-methyltransferase [Arthrobacter sp. MYb224]
MNTQTPDSNPTSSEAQLLRELHTRLERSAGEQQLIDIAYRVVDSPIGRLLMACTEVGLVRVAFESEGHESILDILSGKVGARILRAPAKLDNVAWQLEEYFAGDRQEFEVPLDLRLSTEFRRQVQLELSQIGYGETWSYARMAERLGKPKAVRAVGSACATNPLPIVLPCHRVLRTDGSLGGYLGGLETKTYLLRMENPDRSEQAPVLF